MKRKELEYLASKNDSEIRLCEILKHDEEGITFIVDEGLIPPKDHLVKLDFVNLVDRYMNEAQISNDLTDFIKCSFENDTLSYLGQDTLFQCIKQCFAEHRPLVLTPDVIWLTICQVLSDYINDKSEEFRRHVTYHEGKIMISVDSDFDLRDSRCDWEQIFEQFYHKVDELTKNNIAQKIVANYSTTGKNERISSIITLLHGVESYFTYSISHCICGIPYITLKGKSDDWRLLMEKADILNEYGLKDWYKWLLPILKEFVRAASGKPHLDFWRNIVLVDKREDFSLKRSCLPDFSYIDGWSVALFYHIDSHSGKLQCDKCYKFDSMKSEMKRVKFNYQINDSYNVYQETPMELWGGIIGVEEDEDTYALTPKIGWFVRQSHEHEETLKRLICNQNIFIEVEDEVPLILNELDTINNLTLSFNNEIVLPEWLLKKDICHLVLYGHIEKEYSDYIKSRISDVEIYDS